MTIIKPFQMLRVMQINFVLMRHAFTRSVMGSQPGFLRLLSYLNPFSFLNRKKSRGESIRTGLENLGPIFVKFGQLLSTRRDLLPEDIISELTKLQDRVPPFDSKASVKIIEQAYKKPMSELFAYFNEAPLASASIAQVHAARLHDGSEVIVKVLRPKIEKIIRRDIALLYIVAKLTERFWSQGKRLRPVELVAEFEQTILGELDLMREAANASQLRHNFIDSNIMYVPKIYWQYTRNNVMVMERIHGIQISDLESLHAHRTNMKKLAENGVEIFFTQVFRDSLFHADMHPGNLFVDVTDPQRPKYIGVDFGIMGTLSPTDLHYLAANLLAFFHRDYRRVAVLHVQSGWVPVDTRVDLFESAIRTVCEPIFERPISEISFGQLLLRLFQTAEQFKMEVQPQLMLLQKTLLSIESLGRMLYPDLDLWQTAKPFMINWMRKHQSVGAILKENLTDWHETAEKILRMPHLMHDVLDGINYQQRIDKTRTIALETRPQPKHGKKYFLLGSGLTLTIASIISFILYHPPLHTISIWQWITGGVGLLFLLLAWSMS